MKFHSLTQEIIYRLVKHGGFSGARFVDWRVNNAFEAPMTCAMQLDIAARHCGFAFHSQNLIKIV